MSSDGDGDDELPEAEYATPVVGYVVLKSESDGGEFLTAVPMIQRNDIVEFESNEFLDLDDREVVDVISAPEGIDRVETYGEGSDRITERSYRQDGRELDLPIETTEDE